MADTVDPKEPSQPSPPQPRGHPPPPPVGPSRARPTELDGATARTGDASHRAIPLPAAATAIYGLVRQKSQYSVAETARRLTILVKGRGFDILGDIDFAGDAGRAGLLMRPMRQVVFGNPRTGTRLVIAAPTVALDLPLRVLVFEDVQGAVWLAYNDAEYLRERHQLSDALVSNLAVVPELVARAISAEPLEQRAVSKDP